MPNNRLKKVKQASLLKILSRIIFYVVLLSVIFWGEGIYQLGIQVSIFTIIATVFELVIEKNSLTGYKYYFYIASLIGLLFGGMLLVKEANEVRQCEQQKCLMK